MYKTSPITQTKSLLQEDDLLLCFDSGYHRYLNWDLETFISKSPDEIIKTKFIDQDGNSWFKISMFTKTLALFPKEEKWLVVKWQSDGTFKYLPSEIEFSDFINAYDYFQKLRNED